MSIDNLLIILSAVCLGLALRPYLNSFRRKATGLVLIGSGFGVLLSAKNVSRLEITSGPEQAKVFVFSLAITAVILAMSVLTLWFVERRRAA